MKITVKHEKTVIVFKDKDRQYNGHSETMIKITKALTSEVIRVVKETSI